MKNRTHFLTICLKAKKMEPVFVQCNSASKKVLRKKKKKKKCCLAAVFLQDNLFVALERNSVSIKIMSLGR